VYKSHYQDNDRINMLWRCRKSRVIFATKQKEANMSETENTKDKGKETKSMKRKP